MKFKDYLEALPAYSDVTVIIAKAVKDEYSPFYHDEYKTTPIRSRQEWLECNGKILELQVINKDHSPIDISGVWYNWYKKGRLKCCILAEKDYLSTMYSEAQAKDMEEYYNDLIK